MRMIIMLAGALLAFTGCRKTDDQKAAESMQKRVEEVQEQKRDVEKAREDVRDEQRDVAKEQQDVVKEQAEVATAEQNLADARARYRTTVNERITKLDEKLARLDAKTDAKSREMAAGLRVRRQELSGKLDQIGTQVEAGWNNFKADLDRALESLEKDIDANL